MTTKAQFFKIIRANVPSVIILPNLAALSLSSNSYAYNVSTGSVLANIVGVSVGSTLSISPEHHIFEISGNTIVRGTNAWSSGNTTVSIIETRFGSPNSPRTSNISITIETPANLAALSITSNTYVFSAALNDVLASISGRTPGSTITITPNDDKIKIGGDQVTLLRGANTWTAGNTNITLRETLTGVPNSPRDTVIPITVSEPGSFDYLISNDATFATVLAYGGTTLSNKRIGIQPGTYSIKQIALANNAQTVTFEGTDPANPPIINRLQLGINSTAQAFNLTFRNIKFVSNSWNTIAPTAINPVIQYIHSNNITFDVCTFRGGYRGDYTVDMDPTKEDYPEYASILPQFTANAITSLIIHNAYVGDLVAPGTINLVFQNVSSTTEFSTLPVATMTVNSSGYIESTNLISGGVSRSPTSNLSTGILSKYITWNNHVRMGVALPFGHQAQVATGGKIGSINVTNCVFSDLGNAFKVSPTDGSAVSLIGNDMARVYQDFISLGAGSNLFTPPPLTIKWNTASNPFAKSGDPGDPHSDFIQCFMNDQGAANTWTNADWSVEIVGNIYYVGSGRGGCQGIFLSDVPATNVGYTGSIKGNLIIDVGTTNGIAIDAMKDVYLYRNTLARWNTANNTNTISFRNASTPNQGQNMVLENAIEGRAIDNIGNLGSLIFDNNILLGSAGSLTTYSSIFANSAALSNTTAGILTSFNTIGKYANVGASTNDGYINYTTRTLDLTKENPGIFFTYLKDQVANTAVNSNWARIFGGPNNMTITTMTNGTYQIADNANGTNASVATSANGTCSPGKYIRINQTTSTTNSASKTSTVLVNGFESKFITTTEATAPFTRITNQGNAYSKIITPPADTGYRKVLIVVKGRLNGNTATGMLAGSTTTTFVFNAHATKEQRFTFNSSPRGFRYSPQFTDRRTFFILYDLTKTSFNDGAVTFWVDNEEIKTEEVTNKAWAGNTTVSIAQIFGSSNSAGLFATGAGASICPANSELEFVWVHGWKNTLDVPPDITQQSVRDLWLADNIGASGQNPAGATPLFYVTGTADDWNAGLTNKGTLETTVPKVTGTYISV
jgi:hypothetical protein